MKLDDNQKANFVQYWGRCPLIDTKTNKLVTIEDVKVKAKGFTGIGYSWETVKEGEQEIMDAHGLVYIHEQMFTTNNLENLEPYFLPTGYYQLYPELAYWVARKTNREIIKGMNRNNTEVKCIQRIFKKSDSPVHFARKDFHIHDAARIFYGKIPDIRASNYSVPGFELDAKLPLTEKLNKLFTDKKDERAIRLSADICIAASDYEIPVVFYKLNPVGYFFEDKVYINKNKEVSREAIIEGTGLDVEIYAD